MTFGNGVHAEAGVHAGGAAGPASTRTVALTHSDGVHVIAVRNDNGNKTMTIKTAAGAVVFEGAANTEEDLKGLSPEMRAKVGPLLEKAKRVHILTVTNEKAIDSNRSSAELARNLARHGIDVVVDRIDAAGQPIGRILRTQAASSEADLLVMGAYGHSRFREFVLGGATRDILANPPVPVLFSH